jgi:hypothetical protein
MCIFRPIEIIVQNYKQITGMSAGASVWIAPPRGCQLAELKCIGRDASFDAERRPRYQWTPERRGCKVSKYLRSGKTGGRHVTVT